MAFGDDASSGGALQMEQDFSQTVSWYVTAAELAPAL